MNYVAPSSEFSAELFFSTVNAYYRTSAVKTALELGVFDAIAEGKKSVEEIADMCSASVRGIRILCYFLASINFLVVDNNLFSMSSTMTMFLCRKSAGYLGSSIDFLLSPYIMDAFSDLTSVVRTGELSLLNGGVVAPDHPQWVTFARAIAPMMALPSMLLADLVVTQRSQSIKVLDIAAGHGLFGIAIAKKTPNAQVTCLDWDNVLNVARENAIKANVNDRIMYISGDAFAVEYGRGYDAIILANFLHHFSADDCKRILSKVKTSLHEHGKVFIFEFIANEDKISPSLATTFSMMMLGTTPLGEVYTYSELQEMLWEAGFANVKLQKIPPAKESVIVAANNL